MFQMLSGVSGVGAPLGFHVWAPRSLICARATGPQVSAGAPGLLITCAGSPGAEGGGVPGAAAAAKSSPTSP